MGSTNFESIRHFDKAGQEYWWARELMPFLEYVQWRKFEGAIDRAKEACEKSGKGVTDHFAGVGNMVSIGAGAKREVSDYKLSRYACYLIAQNGDPSKEAIAKAQRYFAEQTRRQELTQALLDDEKRLEKREKVRTSNRKLVATAANAGVTNFGKFHNAGYEGLYTMPLKEIKAKKGIKEKDDLLDNIGWQELAANDFKAAQAEQMISRLEQPSAYTANTAHFQAGAKVRATIRELGNPMPEDLPKAEPIKEVKKRLSAAKKAPKKLN